jgi:hypothetical protein
MPAPGEPFNPWRGSCGFYVPDVVGRNTTLGLTDGQKRIYERLVRFAGQNGRCFPSGDLLALELGKSLRQIRADLKKLKQVSLIDWSNRDGGRNNKYLFLWHAIFDVQPTALQSSNDPDVEMQSIAPQMPTADVQSETREVHDTTFEVQPTALLTCSPLHTNSVHRIQSGNSAHEKARIPASPTRALANASQEQEIYFGFTRNEIALLDREAETSVLVSWAYDTADQDDKFAGEFDLLKCDWLDGAYARLEDAILHTIRERPHGWSRLWSPLEHLGWLAA